MHLSSLYHYDSLTQQLCSNTYSMFSPSHSPLCVCVCMCVNTLCTDYKSLKSLNMTWLKCYVCNNELQWFCRYSSSLSLSLSLCNPVSGQQTQHWSRILREPRSRQTDLHLLWDTERSGAAVWQASLLHPRLRKTPINSKSPPARLQRLLWITCQDSWKTLCWKYKFVFFFLVPCSEQ